MLRDLFLIVVVAFVVGLFIAPSFTVGVAIGAIVLVVGARWLIRSAIGGLGRRPGVWRR